MIFRQLFEPLSSTYTYLLGCEETGAAVLIDPVVNAVERDLAEVAKLGLRLELTLETHIHADHISGALSLKRRVGSRIGVAAQDELPCADVAVEDGKPIRVGTLELEPIHTPGHTQHHFAYRLGERVFTGDALLIEACGRTDFQGGDASSLYHSVRSRLFALAADTLVYPGHDYQGRRVSSIAQERARNPRLGGERTLAEFVTLMNELKLPYPKFIDYAVPGNQQCGVCPVDMPQQLASYCQRMEASPQG
jgi:sulfur dioxygenase